MRQKKLLCILILLIAGCKPSVTIISPVTGARFAAGEEITFTGDAEDPQHPDLSEDSFIWASDKDGEIGKGSSFTSAKLSVNVHTITLTVSDPDGLSGQDSVTIYVGTDETSTTTTAIQGYSSTSTIESTERFIDNNNGTVTDMRTGVVWLQNANPIGYHTWYTADGYCSFDLENGVAGLTDGSVALEWRLPTIDELQGVGTDPPATWTKEGYPSVPWTTPGAPFIDIQASMYWSRTTHSFASDEALSISMKNGFMFDQYKGIGQYVWCVWDGQSSGLTTSTTTTASTGASTIKITDHIVTSFKNFLELTEDERGSCVKPAKKTTITNSGADDDGVVSWLQFTNYKDSDVISWKWYNQATQLIWEYEWYVGLMGEEIKGCAWSGLPFEYLQEGDDGDMHVDVYLNGVKTCTDYFTLTK